MATAIKTIPEMSKARLILEIVYYSRHAREQMITPGISEQEVREAIQSGTKMIQDDKIIAEYRYFAVVYKIFEQGAYYRYNCKTKVKKHEMSNMRKGIKESKDLRRTVWSFSR